MSELATDLSNDIVRDVGWDAEQLQSPHQHLLEGAVNILPADIPFAQAADLAVEIPPDDSPKADCYIDDIFSAFLEDDMTRGSRVIPFIVHLLSRPIDSDESLRRDDILSLIV